ncbi:hypothetical protein KIN20_033000 [Parelaphostrongylus tenuis]|uniref:Uncharacterized protein n=1 Tax=Parelaphostrongylus tenuis TaxID=148309 RepID=A0AAD5R7V0_PARTN|nr:hypothetical protein KIN20_033000 [Parelaphostrongylus tenuis]
MKILQVTLLVANAGLVYSTETTSRQSVTDQSFEEKVNAGYNLLKNVPNEEDTVKFLKQLHNMEKELKNQLSQAPQELPIEIMSYLEEKKDDIKPPGYAIEEVNHNSNVDLALFQGDIVLTKYMFS